jgi:hypothetical protein
MDAREFARLCRIEKDTLGREYLNPDSRASVSRDIKALQLSPDQMSLMERIVDGILTDTFYSFLLTLDGAGSLGGNQQEYRLYDEDGNLVFESGDLEAAAYEHLREDQST